ncbi:hypothetical protein [Streptomyces sp. NEAU-S77]|uniref:hypothetical protein n=1 Tax=Streptomyces sp. NEAU-S77 TaxID=3411033 RepID=UPI003BA0ADB0
MADVAAAAFPDANTLLLPGRQPALVDSGFVGHAEVTADWARAQAGTAVGLVMNTPPPDFVRGPQHSDHVGGNALLQARGAAVAGGAPEAEAIGRSADPLERPDDPGRHHGR